MLYNGSFFLCVVARGSVKRVINDDLQTNPTERDTTYMLGATYNQFTPELGGLCQYGRRALSRCAKPVLDDEAAPTRQPARD